MTRTRRGFLKAGALAGAAAALGRSVRADSTRPNIVLLLADQLRYQSCGYAGDDKAETPHLDRLAASGVNFRQAVSAMPVCSAFRASLLTGKHTSSTGMVINELRMNPGHRCLGHCLTDAGYDTGYIGKWHLYANQLGSHDNPKNSFVPRGKHRLGFDGYWAAYNFHHDYYGAYYHTESPEKIPYGKGVYEPDGQTDLAIDYLKRADGRDKPFFLMVSYGTPHDPWERNNVPRAYYDRFREVPFPPPANYSEETDPYGDDWSNLPHPPEKLEEWQRIYHAMTANLDWNVGRVLDALKERGLERDTVVLFTSDHGEQFGAHGRMKKNIFYEEAARVPFLMRWPGRIPGGLASDACMNTVDIMPTLLGLAGIKSPDGVEGADLSALALGGPGPEPDFAFLMNTGACAKWEDGHEWRAVRDRRFTYAVLRGWEARGLPRRELLFDHVNDPLQMADLSGAPEHADRLEEYRRKLRRKMESLNDNFPPSTWYRDNWIEDRCIQRTATMG